MASKSGKDCCCNGCQQATAGSSPEAFLKRLSQYCCRCLPKALCVNIAGVRQMVPLKCETWTAGDPVLYTAKAQVNGEELTIGFRLTVEESEPYDCFFCLVIPDLQIEGAIPYDCVLLEKSNYYDPCYPEYDPCDEVSEFCCDFATEWFVDVSYFGNGEISEIDISTSLADNLSLKGEIACGNCDCICRCMCFSVGATGPSGTEFSMEEVCTDDPVEPVWFRSDGWRISLSGKSPVSLVDFNLVEGSSTGDAENILNSDMDLTQTLQPNTSGILDARYIFDTGTKEAAIDLTWWASVEEAGAVVEIQVLKWETEEWEVMATLEGLAPHPYYLPLTVGLNPDQTGTGSNEGQVSIRLYSETVTKIVTSYVEIVSPDCCMLSLGLPPYVDVIDLPVPIALKFPIECPNPFGFWELESADATFYSIGFSCVNCDACEGVTVIDCCPVQIPPHDCRLGKCGLPV